jgi:hypothetical protein
VIEKTTGISNHILKAVNVALNIPYKQLNKIDKPASNLTALLLAYITK